VLKSRFLFNIIKDTQPEIFFSVGEDVVKVAWGVYYYMLRAELTVR